MNQNAEVNEKELTRIKNYRLKSENWSNHNTVMITISKKLNQKTQTEI